MRILFLSEVVPHARVVSGAVNVNRRICLLAARGHEVGLAAFIRPSEVEFIPELRPALYEMELLPAPPERQWLRRAIVFGLRGVPGPFAEVRDRAMQQLVGRMIDRSHYDVVVAEFTGMGQYLHRNPYLPPVRRVISVHTCLTTALRRTIQLNPWSWASLRARLRLAAIERYEFAVYRSADQLLALSGEERVDLQRYAPDLRVSVVPYGVDTDHFRPRPDVPPEECLVYTGYFRQFDNRDAVFWFLREVWPRLRERWPALKFYIVGQAPPPEFYDAVRRDERIVVTGGVPDVADYLARARVYICPMRMGSGFRGKILQAMAAGVPVVATTMAAAGIPAQSGANMMLADTPDTMVRAINLLLEDAYLRQGIADRARDVTVERFAWPHCVDLLERVLTGLVT